MEKKQENEQSRVELWDLTDFTLKEGEEDEEEEYEEEGIIEPLSHLFLGRKRSERQRQY